MLFYNHMYDVNASAWKDWYQVIILENPDEHYQMVPVCGDRFRHR